MLGNIRITKPNQLIRSEHAPIRPAPGSDFLFSVEGWATSLRGINVEDNGGAARHAVLEDSATAGSTSIKILREKDGVAFKKHQRVAVQLDSGLWATSWIIAAHAKELELKDPLPAKASRGNKIIASFGLIHVSGATRCNIEDIILTNAWAGIMIDDPDANEHFGVERCQVRKCQAEWSADLCFDQRT